MQYQADSVRIGQQIIRLILTSPNPSMVLPRIGQLLAEVFQADACWLAVLNATDRESPPAVFWHTEDLPTGASEQQLLKYPIAQAILAEAETLGINDTQGAEFQELFLPENLSVRAILGIAPKFQGQANGIIALGRRQPHDWSPLEKELLKEVSESVAVAMYQAQLQQQVRATTQYQTLLNQLTRAIHSALDLDRILQMVNSGTAEALQVDGGLLLLLKYTDLQFHSPSLKRLAKAKATVAYEWFNPLSTEYSGDAGNIASANPLPSFLNSSFWLSECSLCQQALAAAPQPLAIGDRHKLSDTDFTANQSSPLSALPWTAILMIPLEHQGTVLGFLVLHQSQPRQWQPEELELMNWVSAQASSAIIQTQTLRQVQNLVEERTAQLQRSLEVQAKLYATTRQQIDQLRQLNQIKDEFLNAMSHELRTPLTKMNLAIRMLKQMELPEEKRKSYLNILDQQCTQEINLINDLLALQQLETKKLPFQSQKIDLKQLIADLGQVFRQQWADKGLNLEVNLPPQPVWLASDYESLNRILLELLTNAGKYSHAQTVVSVQTTCDANQVAIAISNWGFGISPDDQAHIFEKFWRGKEATGQVLPGTGLGLALVKSLVQHLNGAIAVSSHPVENSQSYKTCFTLSLPQFRE